MLFSGHVLNSGKNLRKGKKIVIEILNVEKVFKNKKSEVHALKNVSLRVEKGDIFGIVGYSGAGKSTLLRLVNLLEKPSSGSVKIEEREKLEKQIKDLKNLNSGEYDKKNKVLQSEIQNLEKQIEKKKVEQEEQNKKIVNLKETLKTLEKNKDNEEEDKLRAQLIKLWGDND